MGRGRSGDASPFLTVIRVVEDDELLPAVLRDHMQDDLVEVDGRPHEERVVVGAAAAGGRAAGARRPGGAALYEEVRDVHGI